MLRKVSLKVLITCILVLLTLIISKKSIAFKTFVYKNVYDKNISFVGLNNLYNKYLGSILPFKLNIGVKPVFNKTFKYNNITKYNDSYQVDVDFNYLVPSIEDGIVIFVGEKELGSTVIIMSDKVEIWYSNIDSNVKLYDYVDKGSFLGEVKDNKLFLTFKSDGEYKDYQEYLSQI